MRVETVPAPGSPVTIVPPPPVTDVFRNNQLLEGIDDNAFRQIADQIDLFRYAPDEIIFEEDDPGECLYLIVEGAVKISKRGRGGQQEVLAHLLQHDFFGEMALVDTGRRSARASAIGRTVLGQVDSGDWDLLLRLAPHQIFKNFSRSATKRIRNNNQHFIEEMMRNERLSLLGTTISSVVHDLNNPINTILGSCHVIQTQVHDELTHKMSGLIRGAIERMMALTGEIIDFSRGETELKLKWFAISELLSDLQPEFAKCRPDIDVRSEVLFEGKIYADKNRLIRVFENLIRNAREAMKGKSDGVLQFAIKQVESSVRFEVTDTGCGIPSQLLPRIFEPFVTHGKAHGTGLGLAISKAVVTAHGGNITVQSNQGGTTFWIDLPLPPETAP